MKYYFDEPDFENSDNEKMARLIAYIPAMIHIQNIIASGNVAARAMLEDKNIYNNMIENSALNFYLSGVNEKDIKLPWEDDDDTIS